MIEAVARRVTDGEKKKGHIPWRAWRARVFWKIRKLVEGRVEQLPAPARLPTKYPKCVIFVMDGNTRYAALHGKDASWGHREGVATARRILEALEGRPVAGAGFWALSIDNFTGRQKSETAEICAHIKAQILEWFDKPKQVRIRFCGSWSQYAQDPDLDRLIAKIEHDTSKYSYRHLTIFLGYSGREDTRHMAIAVARDFVASGRPMEDLESVVTQEYIQDRLQTSHIDDEDLLIIRTGELPGQAHTSDFVQWQLRGAEWKFTTTLWPAFTVEELDAILEEYGSRPQLKGKARVERV